MTKKPLPRGNCLDCKSEFAICRAVHRLADTILPEGELEILICPECGSYSVEEGCRHDHQR